MAFHLAAELDLLRLRLHMYDDIVDLFLVSEGALGQQSFSRKPLLFEPNRDLFKPFLRKVRLAARCLA